MDFPKLVVKEHKADGTIVSTCQLASDNFETIVVKGNNLKAWGNPVHQVWSASLEEAMDAHKRFLEAE